MNALLKNILVAISGSDISMHAAQYGIMMAKTYRCELTAVYVVDTATLKELLLAKIFVEEESLEYQQSLEANGHRYLNYVEELAASKGLAIKKILRHGTISTEILNTAEEIKADLIVLGGWTEDPASRDLLSRSRREVLMHAKCSVLVAKEPKIESRFKRF